ncbi:hypothetical protein HGRIS_004384 [Hohenbuehelia grisea]|uniref:SHSP domain-containing protein n=1 Tax=Hohenbuehelia grisea TaxID=104357 RepID=A0ABR3JCA0_9AGAR
MHVIASCSSASTQQWPAARPVSPGHKRNFGSETSSQSSSSSSLPNIPEVLVGPTNFQHRPHSSSQTTASASVPSLNPPDEMLHHLALRISTFPSLPFGALGIPQRQSPIEHQPPSPVVSSPLITTLHNGDPSTAPHGIASPMARSRRAPPPADTPPMAITSTPYRHTLDVCLPRAIQPEMVTVSARKGDKLSVIADAWHMERNCHYEWEIAFPPRDVDMGSVHAKFESDGRLVINIRRRQGFHSFI